jgi:hypothetical protein
MKEERIILKLKEKLSLSDEKHGIVCLTGHVGIAHAHGANNYSRMTEAVSARPER